MMYWDDFYIPMSTAWRTASIPFYLLIAGVNVLFILSCVSLYASMKHGEFNDSSL